MPAMTMPFDVHPDELDGLQNGDAIRFTLHANVDSSWISGIAPLAADEPPLVLEETPTHGQAGRVEVLEVGDAVPDVLVMTATPIPRTLALTLFADLDLSVIDEMPPGRIPIQTRVIAPHGRERAYNFVEGQLEQGRQAFIVYPLVEASDKIEAESAIEAYDKLQKVFYDYRVGLLHGRLKPSEKDEVMQATGDDLASTDGTWPHDSPSWLPRGTGASAPRFQHRVRHPVARCRVSHRKAPGATCRRRHLGDRGRYSTRRHRSRSLRPNVWYLGSEALLDELYVEPSVRTEGIGSGIIDFLLATARERRVGFGRYQCR